VAQVHIGRFRDLLTFLRLVFACPSLAWGWDGGCCIEDKSNYDDKT